MKTTKTAKTPWGTPVVPAVPDCFTRPVVNFVFPEREPGGENFRLTITRPGEDEQIIREYPYTVKQLEKAFAQIEPKDWKDRISVFVTVSSPADLGIITTAIVFYTATWPTLTNTNHGAYCIEAQGYRAGPAGDH